MATECQVEVEATISSLEARGKAVCKEIKLWSRYEDTYLCISQTDQPVQRATNVLLDLDSPAENTGKLYSRYRYPDLVFHSETFVAVHSHMYEEIDVSGNVGTSNSTAYHYQVESSLDDSTSSSVTPYQSSWQGALDSSAASTRRQQSTRRGVKFWLVSYLK